MTWRQRWCGLRHGHDRVLTFEGRRMFLKCTSCRHETPGLEIGGRPRVRYAGDPRRHVARPHRLVVRQSA